MRRIAIFLLLMLSFATISAAERISDSVDKQTESYSSVTVKEKQCVSKAEPVDTGELSYYSVYGEVSSLDKNTNTITVLEYDYENEKEIGIPYLINEDTLFDGVEVLNDIEPGDWVDIEYYLDESQNRIASFVAVEREPSFEESDTEESQ